MKLGCLNEDRRLSKKPELGTALGPTLDEAAAAAVGVGAAAQEGECCCLVAPRHKMMEQRLDQVLRLGVSCLGLGLAPAEVNGWISSRRRRRGRDGPSQP